MDTRLLGKPIESYFLWLGGLILSEQKGQFFVTTLRLNRAYRKTACSISVAERQEQLKKDFFLKKIRL
jgi:hypothetical protein